MMATTPSAIDVVDRLAYLRQTEPALRLYALVDGAQCRLLGGEPWQPHPAFFALFSGTADAALAHAGPWLVDTELAGQAFTTEIARFEKQAPAVAWLFAMPDLLSLGRLLQQKLDTRLPDGRMALLRFWDPRVLLGVIEVLGPEQRETFFAHIHEWHLLRDQQRVWIGRQHA